VSGQYGLFGSGEFLPWAGPVDRWLVSSAGREVGRVLVVPTASAPEGDGVFQRWGTMGVEHYRELGLVAEVVDLKVRDDAFRPELVARVAGASLVFFSGGNPAHLVRSLQDTPFWAALTAEVEAGCAMAGSSAGIGFLGVTTIDSAAAANGLPDFVVPGIGWFSAVFGPHWDAMEGWHPGSQAMMMAAAPAACAFLGVDEDTAVVGDGKRWEVRGRGTATVRQPGSEPFVVGTGESFDLALRGPTNG
jgi:cyanophycinase